MERNAFARARTFLNYQPLAKWGALVASVGTAILTVALILVMALFADLLVYQGHIPAYTQLSPSDRTDFERAWSALPEEARTEAVQSLQLRDSVRAARIADTAALVDSTGKIQMPDIELRWRAYVWKLLVDRVSPEAAQRFAGADSGPDTPPSVRVQELVRRSFQVGEVLEDPSLHFGILSQIVRDANNWTGSVLAWFISWNSWTWNAPEGRDANVNYLFGLFVLTLVLVIVRAIFSNAMNYFAAKATLDAVTRLRRAIYHHTYRLPTLSIRSNGLSEAVSLFTRHVESVHDGLHRWLTAMFRHPVQFGLLLLFALSLHFWLAITFILFMLLVWLIGGQILAISRQQSKIATRRAANRLALLQESITMMRVVKSYLMELFNQGRVERQLSEYAKASMRRYRGEANATPSFVLLGSIVAVILLYIAGRIVLSEGFSVANLATLTTILVSLYFPARGWLDSRRFLKRGRESAAILFEFLDRKGEVTQSIDAEFVPPLEKQIDFNDVSLREPGTGRMLLQNVSFSIAAGQRVCIVGPDENEKLALVYLVPRFLDPTGGDVRLDGRNVRWVTQDSLRTQVATVLQSNLVFNDTVAHNIGCGDQSYTLPQIIEAAKLAHAHQFISSLPNGYETPIGDLGVSLRPGEKFRIALARAILRDPSVFVIEEPNFPIDDDTKALLDDTLERVLPGRTVIFIAHRASTIRKADQVILINDGRVEAIGEHRELIRTSDLYKHLHYLEFNAFADQM